MPPDTASYVCLALSCSTAACALSDEIVFHAAPGTQPCEEGLMARNTANGKTTCMHADRYVEHLLGSMTCYLAAVEIAEDDNQNLLARL